MIVEEFISRTGIKCLYHFTDKENLPLIRQHGLNSLSLLNEKGITPPKAGGNEWSQRADQRKGLNKYVHLCLLGFHPMEHMARKEGRISHVEFLEISKEVLFFNGVMGCPQVANESNSNILPVEDAFEKIDIKLLFRSNLDFKNIVNQYHCKEAAKAEILIPDKIDKKYILTFNS